MISKNMDDLKKYALRIIQENEARSKRKGIILAKIRNIEVRMNELSSKFHYLQKSREYGQSGYSSINKNGSEKIQNEGTFFNDGRFDVEKYSSSNYVFSENHVNSNVCSRPFSTPDTYSFKELSKNPSPAEIVLKDSLVFSLDDLRLSHERKTNITKDEAYDIQLCKNSNLHPTILSKEGWKTDDRLKNDTVLTAPSVKTYDVPELHTSETMTVTGKSSAEGTRKTTEGYENMELKMTMDDLSMDTDHLELVRESESSQDSHSRRASINVKEETSTVDVEKSVDQDMSKAPGTLNTDHLVLVRESESKQDSHSRRATINVKEETSTVDVEKSVDQDISKAPGTLKTDHLAFFRESECSQDSHSRRASINVKEETSTVDVEKSVDQDMSKAPGTLNTDHLAFFRESESSQDSHSRRASINVNEETTTVEVEKSVDQDMSKAPGTLNTDHLALFRESESSQDSHSHRPSINVMQKTNVLPTIAVNKPREQDDSKERGTSKTEDTEDDNVEEDSLVEDVPIIDGSNVSNHEEAIHEIETSTKNSDDDEDSFHYNHKPSSGKSDAYLFLLGGADLRSKSKEEEDLTSESEFEYNFAT